MDVRSATLCLALLLASFAAVTNAALLSLQSCTQKNNAYSGEGHCNKAIDGNTNQDWGKHSCTHTNGGSNNLWTAQTSTRSNITSVTIYNRMDAVQRRLNNFVIEVDGQQCASYKSSGYFSVKTFSCNAVGSSVTIRSRKNDALTLCEVKVYGKSVGFGFSQLGLQYCMQSNNAYSSKGHCHEAIDGNANQDWSKNTCTHTKNGNNNWWTAHTPTRSLIKYVTIYNRMDNAVQTRLSDFVIEVDGVQCASYRSSGYFSVKTFQCNKIGSSITIRSRKNAPLTLCEVKIHGKSVAVGSSAQLGLTQCTQNNNAYSKEGHCHEAIDGNTNQDWGKHSCTHTKGGNNNVWTAQISKRSQIKYVTIYNRMDAVQTRLSNFVIEVDGSQCASYKSNGYFSVKTFKCNATGSSVTIRSRKNAPLTLCEVKVFGKSVGFDSSQLGLQRCTQNNNAYSRNGHCHEAIDGNTNQDWGKNTCTHTKNGKNNVWTAQTSTRSLIKYVTIYNRMDNAVQTRLSDFVIEVDGVQCASYRSSGYFSVKTFQCNKIGSSITIRSRKNAPLTLCEVKIHGKSVGFGSSQLKLQHCSQKNNVYSRYGHCHEAIDGNTNQDWAKHSCTHTKSGKNNWWTAHTPTISKISYVTIYNRMDNAVQTRLSDFVIEVDGKQCASYKSSGYFSVKTFACNAIGSTVTIRSKKNAPLTLCEVKIHGKSVELSKSSRLKLQHCSQKNNAYSRYGHCHEAIDGNTNQDWAKHSCTHTKGGKNNWWTAHTPTISKISYVTIYNRMDNGVQKRLSNFVIEVDGKQCASYKSSGYFSVKRFKCDAVGSSVTIRSRKNDALTLCEVRVYGKSVELSKSSALKLSKCSQKNNAYSRYGHCHEAIDGNTNQKWAKHSCTHTKSGKNNWWTAHTPTWSRISYVTIYNRMDSGVQKRLNNFVIEVNGNQCASYKSSGYFSVKRFKCNGVGSTVTIRSRKNDALTLCEVKVYGRPEEKPVFKSLGCYGRDWSTYFAHLHIFDANKMTLSMCNSECKAVSASRMFVLNGKRCVCAFDLFGLKRRSRAECNVKCAGDRTETCGGKIRYSVFVVKY